MSEWVVAMSVIYVYGIMGSDHWPEHDWNMIQVFNSCKCKMEMGGWGIGVIANAEADEVS
jgi:hypothetical protein